MCIHVPGTESASYITCTYLLDVNARSRVRNPHKQTRKLRGPTCSALPCGVEGEEDLVLSGYNLAHLPRKAAPTWDEVCPLQDYRASQRGLSTPTPQLAIFTRRRSLHDKIRGMPPSKTCPFVPPALTQHHSQTEHVTISLHSHLLMHTKAPPTLPHPARQ